MKPEDIARGKRIPGYSQENQSQENQSQENQSQENQPQENQPQNIKDDEDEWLDQLWLDDEIAIDMAKEDPWVPGTPKKQHHIMIDKINERKKKWKEWKENEKNPPPSEPWYVIHNRRGEEEKARRPGGTPENAIVLGDPRMLESDSFTPGDYVIYDGKVIQLTAEKLRKIRFWIGWAAGGLTTHNALSNGPLTGSEKNMFVNLPMYGIIGNLMK